ncbi:MAG: response regulator [Litorimonas sp.]
MSTKIGKNDIENKTLALVLESLPVAVMAYKAGILLYANDSYHKYIGPEYSAIMQPGLRIENFVEQLYDLHQDLETEDAELDRLHKTDKAEWIKRRSSAYYEDNNFEQYDSKFGWWQCINKYYPEDELYIGIRININTLKTAQEKAIIASQSKSEFLANMSHEIRTPMNGIMGMAELLQNSQIPGKEREFINIIQRSGQSLLTIINDILDFSKIESGQIEITPVPFSLRDAIEDIMALLSTSTRETGVDLIIKIDPNIPKNYIGDVGRIRQILMNVIGNAVKFTHEGHVLIDVSAITPNSENPHTNLQDDISLKIDITDTGIGILPIKLAHIFEKFTQVDSSTTREYGGTGLGLSIAKNLSILMGGNLTAQSTLGKGSTFTLNLPLPVSHINTATDAKPTAPVKGNFLVIDDTPVNYEVLKGQLENESCKVVGVNSAAQGLSVLKKALETDVKIDLVLLDYHMPQHTGEDFILAMRKHTCFDHIPVIMLSSVDTDVLKKRVLLSGVQEFMTKPARLADLQKVISQTLAASAKPMPLAARLAQPNHNPAVQEDALAAKNRTDVQSHIDILIAEDNEVNQMYMKYIMEELGVSFKIAENGRIAVDKWQLLQPKLILMDISMPQLNGNEATQKIRSKEVAMAQVSRVPIIAVTAHAMKGDKEKFISAGMDDYLSKPVSQLNLIKKIQQWAPSIKMNIPTENLNQAS